jgi:hypothetical protein
MEYHKLPTKINSWTSSEYPHRLWLSYTSFTLLALVAPALMGYDIYFQLISSGGSVSGPGVIRLVSTAGLWRRSGYLPVFF